MAKKNKMQKINKTGLKKMIEDRKKNQPKSMKICPFRGGLKEKVPCTSECALYRSEKRKGFECPFTESTTISWRLKMIWEFFNK